MSRRQPLDSIRTFVTGRGALWQISRDKVTAARPAFGIGRRVGFDCRRPAVLHQQGGRKPGTESKHAMIPFADFDAHRQRADRKRQAPPDKRLAPPDKRLFASGHSGPQGVQMIWPPGHELVFAPGGVLNWSGEYDADHGCRQAS